MYTPPAGNAVNFELSAYTVVSGNVVNFELSDVVPVISNSNFLMFF